MQAENSYETRFLRFLRRAQTALQKHDVEALGDLWNETYDSLPYEQALVVHTLITEKIPELASSHSLEAEGLTFREFLDLYRSSNPVPAPRRRTRTRTYQRPWRKPSAREPQDRDFERDYKLESRQRPWTRRLARERDDDFERDYKLRPRGRLVELEEIGDNQELYRAAKYGQQEFVDQLISQGADDWNAGLRGAARGGHWDLVEFFESRGADDWEGAYNEAFLGGHKEIGIYLQNKVEI